MLNPGVDGVLGIRIPQLRLLAKGIATDSSWQEYVASADTEFMESRMLHGMVIGYVKGITLRHRLALIADWVPRINSWSVCDCVCSTFKLKRASVSSGGNSFSPISNQRRNTKYALPW